MNMMRIETSLRNPLHPSNAGGMPHGLAPRQPVSVITPLLALVVLLGNIKV
jgi:hypothetical protein